MNKTIQRYLIIGSLTELGRKINLSGVPENVVNAAIRDNPWFTPRYIQKAVENISQWMQENLLENFVASYPEKNNPPRFVTLIAAGNIPLVGWHDLMVIALSGHIAGVRCSHKDQVLMRWLAGEWIKLLPELADRIIWENVSREPDFVIGTGSNNTARYLKTRFRHVSGIIRRNRYSLAILRPDMTENEIAGLAEDIFLYNGLGCRNVSNLMVMPGTNWKGFLEKISQYPLEYLNPLYLERVLHERAKRVVWGESFIDCGNLLIESVGSPGNSDMGVLRQISITNEAELCRMIQEYREDIQCLVGMDTSFGATQCPSLFDFADNVDTMKALAEI